MRYALLLIIKLYWLVPKGKRRNCLFKKSCSHFVYEATAQHGIIKGLKALQYRINNCRAGSSIYVNPVTGKTEMQLPNNEIIGQEDIADRLLISSLS